MENREGRRGPAAMVVLALAALALSASCAGLGAEYPEIVADLESRSRAATAGGVPQRPITEADLAALPAAVAGYLRFSGVVGKVPVRTVRLTQTGRIKTDLDQPWRRFTAGQFYAVNLDAYVWYGIVPLGPFRVEAFDRFDGGTGTMTVKAASLVNLGRAEGPETDVSEFIRFFNEMMWFPTALLDPRISWTADGDSGAIAVFRAGGLEATARLGFSPEGALVSWETEDRYALVGGKPVRARWTTHGAPDDLLLVQGYRLPRGGSATWTFTDGSQFHYIDIFVDAIAYDPPDSAYLFRY